MGIDTRDELGRFKKGFLPWITGKKHSQESITQMSLSHKGRIPWNLGLTKELCPIIAKTGFQKGNKLALKRKSVGNGWETGKQQKYGKKRFIKIVKAKRGKSYPKMSASKLAEKNPAWIGGHSKKYGNGWTRKLRESVRIRDLHTCKLCLKKFTSTKLDVHHIDYNKNNHVINNLISLCHPCHAKTLFRRSDWSTYFNKLVVDK